MDNNLDLNSMLMENIGTNNYNNPLVSSVYESLNLSEDTFKVNKTLIEHEGLPSYESSLIIDEDIVNKYFEMERLAKHLDKEIKDFKEAAKNFIEQNKLTETDLVSNGMKIVYTHATTTSTIDTTFLKSNYPDIAAKCTVTNPRKSSITIKED